MVCEILELEQMVGVPSGPTLVRTTQLNSTQLAISGEWFDRNNKSPLVDTQ